MSTAADDLDFSWLDEEPVKPIASKHDLPTRNRRATPGSAASDHRKSMTNAKWKRILELTANGLRRADVLATTKTTKETFDAHLIESVQAGKQLREADAIWLRRSWPLDDIEQVLTKVSLGHTVRASFTMIFGEDEDRLGAFYRLVRTDVRIRDMYDVARQLQAEAWVDDNIDISDNRGGDTYVDSNGKRKTDHAVIQRDKLRIETRQWTMGAMHRKRFGEHKHIDHGGELQVNHAVQLSNARKRLEKAKGVTIDNQSQQVVEERDNV